MMSGNIDILSTVSTLAGVEYDEIDYDGQNWTEIFDGNAEWKRTNFISQYISTGTVANGQYGQAYMVDEQYIGNWRALRVINETNDNTYVEWY